jgi:hypothetical protein
MSFELKYLTYKNKYLNSLKQIGGKFLLDDIYNLDDFVYNRVVEPTEEKIILTLQHIIFAKQIENLLKNKLNIDDVKSDNLDIKKIINILVPEKKDIYDFIFNNYTLSDFNNVVNKIAKINSLVFFQFDKSYHDKVFEIIKKNKRFVTYTLHTIDTCCLYNISFSNTFDEEFSKGNIERTRVEKKEKFPTIHPYNFTGLWFKTNKSDLTYYLHRAISNQHKDSSRKATFFPTIRTFKIIKNIPNILIFSSYCPLNVEILEETCTRLNKKIPDTDQYAIFRKLYIDNTHEYYNYFLVWMINEINRINPCSFDEQLNGWLCPADNNEIFIQNTKEYISITERELISKIIYDDEEDPKHGKIIYENQNIINFINTYLYKLYQSNNAEIITEINNNNNILPDIYQICNNHIYLYPLY